MLKEPYEEQSDELTILPRLFWIAIIFLAFGLLAGCATNEPTSNVCCMRILGHTKEGYTVVMQSCVTPEAFAESQK